MADIVLEAVNDGLHKLAEATAAQPMHHAMSEPDQAQLDRE